MKKSRLLGAVCAFLLFITVTPAIGSIIYGYTGNTFDEFSSPSSYTTSMAVTGTIELAAPLAANMSLSSVIPITFSFNDGINTINQSNATAVNIEVGTDSAGLIDEWFVSLSLNSAFTTIGDTLTSIQTQSDDNFVRDQGDRHTCTNANCRLNVQIDYGAIEFTPGSWSVVPIPAAVWLFGSGLLGLIGVARRKVRV